MCTGYSRWTLASTISAIPAARGASRSGIRSLRAHAGAEDGEPVAVGIAKVRGEAVGGDHPRRDEERYAARFEGEIGGVDVRHLEDHLGARQVTGLAQVGSAAKDEGHAAAIEEHETLERHLHLEAERVAIEGERTLEILDAEHDRSNLGEPDFRRGWHFRTSAR